VSPFEKGENDTLTSATCQSFVSTSVEHEFVSTSVGQLDQACRQTATIPARARRPLHSAYCRFEADGVVRSTVDPLSGPLIRKGENYVYEMPGKGIEPLRPFGHRILSYVRRLRRFADSRIC
jgi:hypothetical protein